MGDPKDIKNPFPAPHVPSVPADQDEDVPRGTPEQGERSADRVGGTGPFEPEPEIEDDENQPDSKRTPGTDDVERDKRRASYDDDEG